MSLLSVVRFQVAMRAPIVCMGRAKVHVDQIQAAMAHPTLGDDFFCKLTHSLHGSFEHDRLDALIVV